jgi:hypothetical protein
MFPARFGCPPIPNILILEARCRAGKGAPKCCYAGFSLASAHIRLDERGVPWIDDTNTKAIEFALDMIAHG